MKVSRCYVGTYVTSMEMAGVSLTIMILNEERKEYLGKPFCLTNVAFHLIISLLFAAAILIVFIEVILKDISLF